jgi:hypothetical protein
VRTLGILLVGTVLALVGVLLGAWWAPFVVGAGAGVALGRGGAAVAAGAMIGLLSWLLPLAGAEARYGLEAAAGSIAAIMGFGHQGVIPLGLTLVLGTLLGLAGGWLGSAGRSLTTRNASDRFGAN